MNFWLHETSHIFPSSTSRLLAASPGDAAPGADGPQPTQRDAARARHQRGRGPGIEEVSPELVVEDFLSEKMF